MGKRSKVLWATLGVAVVGWLGWEVLRPREPVYQGKRLSQWLDAYNKAGSMDKIGPVSEAIRAMGTNSLPFLLANMERQGSPLKRKLVSLIARQHWVKLPFYGDDPYCLTSVLALSALGSNAAPLCPDLLRVAEGNGNYWLGTMGLLAIGPMSIPTLEKICQSTNELVRGQAVLMISMMKTMPPPYFSWRWDRAPLNGKLMFGIGYAVSGQDIDAMAELLANPDPAVRRASAETIGDYAYPPYRGVMETVMAPLKKALLDPDAGVRAAAAQTLKAINADIATSAGGK